MTKLLNHDQTWTIKIWKICYDEVLWLNRGPSGLYFLIFLISMVDIFINSNSQVGARWGTLRNCVQVRPDKISYCGCLNPDRKVLLVSCCSERSIIQYLYSGSILKNHSDDPKNGPENDEKIFEGKMRVEKNRRFWLLWYVLQSY